LLTLGGRAGNPGELDAFEPGPREFSDYVGLTLAGSANELRTTGGASHVHDRDFRVRDG
jgi:hypothetical protein